MPRVAARDPRPPGTRKHGDTAGIPKVMNGYEWNKLLDAFRANPGGGTKANYAAVMRATRRSYDLIRRAWLHGWPELNFEPIEAVITRELQEARAARAEREAEVDRVTAVGEAKRVTAALLRRDAARAARLRDSAKVRTDEALLVSAARQNALALAGVTAHVLHGAMAVAARIDALLIAESKSPSMTIETGMYLARQASAIVRLGNEASKMAVQTERLILGEPEGGDEADGAKATMTAEESERWLEATVRALERAKANGAKKAGERDAGQVSGGGSGSRGTSGARPAEPRGPDVAGAKARGEEKHPGRDVARALRPEGELGSA